MAGEGETRLGRKPVRKKVGMKETWCEQHSCRLKRRSLLSQQRIVAVKPLLLVGIVLKAGLRITPDLSPGA